MTEGDIHDADVLRRRMVDEQIRQRGITHPRVLDVMSTLPRERFITGVPLTVAYGDHALPIESGQTISQPYMVAAMSAALDPSPTDRVLEIGTGSGYQAAVLAMLAGHVYTVERIADLQVAALLRFADLGISNVTGRVGDGTLGWPAFAPYQRIIVTAGAPEPPAALFAQLAEGGRMVVPVGSAAHQVLLTIDKVGGRIVERAGVACRFVPLIGDQGWQSDA